MTVLHFSEFSVGEDTNAAECTEGMEVVRGGRNWHGAACTINDVQCRA